MKQLFTPCHHFHSYILFLLIIASTSCVNTRRATYFNGQKDTTLLSLTIIPETVIQKNDLLSISISSLNPDASALFNFHNISYGGVSPNTNLASQESSGYLVSQDGYIQLPILGKIQAAGLTAALLKNVVTESLVNKKLLVDPIVSVRYLNFRVTILGEVARPTVVNVPNERITMLEALGLAGDITIFGKRDNVMLIREENGNKIIKRLDLNSGEFLNSPFYYLKSNDIVYVEPNKTRVANSTRSMQLLPILLSALSFTAIIVDRLTRP